MVNSRRGVEINKKSGIHVFFPDLAMDRRKLIELRAESLDIADFFLGCDNDKEDIFDKGVYQACGLLLHGSSKPGRTSYFISRRYIIRTSNDNGNTRFELAQTDELSVPSNGEILKTTMLRIDENDPRIAPNLVPISIPIQPQKITCKPNHNVK